MTQEQYDAECEYWANLEEQREWEQKEKFAILDVALLKSYTFCEEYNPTTGCITEKNGARYLKEGYIEGFLSGFTYRLTGD
jgi:hypothetical protein